MSPPFVLASELVPGDYVCLKTKSLFGAMIRLFTRSQYDHAVLVIAPGEIVQATLRGVRRSPLSDFHGCMAVANSGEAVTGLARVTIVAAASARVGHEYAYALIPVIGLRRLGLRWAWLLKISDDKDADICSELVSAAGQTAGEDWLCGEPSPACVTPPELSARKPFMRSVVWD